MAALGQLAPWRHVVVGGSVAAVGFAAFTGIIGEDHSERFDSKQVVIAPAGTDGLRITETVDQDFGNARRHGFERIIPDDFGIPTDVTASSPDAPDDLDVSPFSWETRIRIGDPNLTVTGQHRYVIAYTLPDAQLSTGELALDVIGTDEALRTEHFEVVVTGLELADPTCNVGSFDDVGGCELIDDGTTYRAVFEPLEPGQGITIGGRIVGDRAVVAIEAPPLPDPRTTHRVLLGVLTTLLGALTGAGVFVWARRRGRNEVFAGGAADAAFGLLSLPSPGEPIPPPPPTRLVADQALAALATTEFAPPTGVEPWLGNVLLRERLNSDTVAAWISAHAARQVLTVERDEDNVVTLSLGPKFASAPEEDRRELQQMLGASGRIRLGTYSKPFAVGWSRIAARQRTFIDGAGFWKRRLPNDTGSFAGAAAILGVAVVITMLLVAQASLREPSLLDHPAVAILLAIAVPGLVAYGVYRTMLPARTAVGSALALRTESFRRFLAASESRHVEWAWERGVLREYSAWAVALGTADAWEAAMQHSAVPPAELNVAPLILWHAGPSLVGSRTTPTSSGGGGRGGGFSGGFSGGSVGGGGGGGSSGSW